MYIGTPDHVDKEKIQTPPDVRTIEDFRYRLITVGEVADRLRK